MKIFAFTAMLVLLPAVLAAQEAEQVDPPATKWTVDGHLRPRTEFRYNNRFNLTPTTARYLRRDNGDSLSLRSRIGLGFQGRELAGAFQLQHVSLWGATGGDETNDPALGLHQAHVTWNPVPKWWLQVGRFEIAYGDQRVLGAPGWNQTGRSWDGVRTGWWFADDIGLDLFGVAYNDGFLSSAPAYEDRIFEDDSFFTGLYFHSKKLSEIVTEVDVYALGDFQFDQVKTGPQRQELAMFGARLASPLLVVEGGYQVGSRCVPVPVADPRIPPTLECTDETVPVSAGFVDAELGISVGDIRPFLGGGLATGDNPDTAKNEAYFHMYPKAHKWLGYIDIIGPRTNIVEARVGATLQLGALTLRESAHFFQALQPSATAVGVEFDTTLGYRFNEMFVAQIGHAVFVPLDGASTDPSALAPTGVGSWWFIMLTFDASLALN